MRAPLLLLACLIPPLLSGCVVASAAGTVAGTGVKVGAKAVGAVGGAAIDGASAAGRAVTGH